MPEFHDTHDARTRDLVAKFSAGDHAAERELFETARAFLVREASAHPWMSGLARWTAPEDVVDETLLRALSSGQLTRFEHRGPGSLNAWLVTILQRVLADEYRRRGADKRGGAQVFTRVQAEASDTGASLAAESAATDTTPSSRVRHAELRELCRVELEPREWQAWRLMHDEGWDTGDVARELGATEGAVRALCARARVKLVRAIQLRHRGED